MSECVVDILLFFSYCYVGVSKRVQQTPSTPRSFPSLTFLTVTRGTQKSSTQNARLKKSRPLFKVYRLFSTTALYGHRLHDQRPTALP